jgi:hypothetical protein
MNLPCSSLRKWLPKPIPLQDEAEDENIEKVSTSATALLEMYTYIYAPG